MSLFSRYVLFFRVVTKCSLRSLAMLTFLIQLLFLVVAHAFIPKWTQSLFGKEGTSHQVMTEDAIKARYFDYFHVLDKDILSTMDDARKEIITACAGVDDPKVLAVSGLSEENLPPADFDG